MENNGEAASVLGTGRNVTDISTEGAVFAQPVTQGKTVEEVKRRTISTEILKEGVTTASTSSFSTVVEKRSKGSRLSLDSSTLIRQGLSDARRLVN